jgi:hypothetical protein
VARLSSLPRPTRWHGVLALLVVAQWGAVAWVASRATHTGWLYGDPSQTASLHAASRAALHGHLPNDGGGFLWPLLTAPFAAAGSSPSAGLAALVLVQVILLLPIALLAFVGAVSRLAGRGAALIAGGIWVLLPVLGSRYFDFRARPVVINRLLPHLVGLVPSPGFVALVVLSLGFFFLARTLDADEHVVVPAVLLGAAASVALACTGTSLLFAAGAAASLALARRRRSLLILTAAAVPGVTAFLLWHLLAPSADAPLFHLDLRVLDANVAAFREYAWSMRVVQWLAVAGSIGLLRSGRVSAAGVALWFWLTVLLRGGVAGFATGDPNHPSADFLAHVLLPAYPTLVLVIAALPLLVPSLPRRLPGREHADPEPLGNRASA